MILRSTPSEIPPVDIFDALDEVVSYPWQSACEKSDYPWLATPSLRQAWIKGMESKDDTTAWAAFFGLVRCAKPQPEENRALNTFLTERKVPQALDKGTVFMDLILTGAAPPLVFGLAFVTQLVQEELNPWTCYVVMSLLRHPMVLSVAQEFAAQAEVPDFLLHSCVSNPLFSMQSVNIQREDFLNNPWVKAMRVFHPLSPKPVSVANMGNMEKFAALLRVDLNKKEFLELSHQIILDEPLNSLLVEHPCLFEPPCPEIDHANPHRLAIEYFSQDNLVKTVHQYYNPMLNYPWMAPFTGYMDNEIFLFSLLVFNHPMLNTDAIFTKEILRQKAKDHFSGALTAYFNDQAQKAQAKQDAESAAADPSAAKSMPKRS